MHPGKPIECLAYMGNDDHHKACCADQLKDGCRAFPPRELKCRTNEQHASCNVSVRCVPALRIDSEVIVAFRLGCWFDGVRQSGGDVPREELVDAVDGMIGDASQHLV